MRRLIARAWGDLLLPNPACPIRRTELLGQTASREHDANKKILEWFS